MPTNVANWTTVQIQLPDAFTDLATFLNDLIGALIAILNIVQTVLSIVKALLIGLLDPVAAIIDALISEIESFLADIRQIGVYVSGDLTVEYPFDTLLGGFSAYERRMIARLVDRSDPTRPNFTANTSVLAVFLYSSFDTTAVAEAVGFISQVKAFFGIRGKPQTYTIPTGLNVTYGATSTSLGTFVSNFDLLKKGYEPSRALVQWQMAPPAGSASISWPLPAPEGFLVEVSTVPDGLFLAWETPASRAVKDSDGNQVKAFGLVTDPDGHPFRLYGGYDMLNVPDLKWDRNGNSYDPPSGGGATVLYGARSAADSVRIPINALKIDDKYILQRTFYVDTKSLLGVNLVAPGQQFSITLDYADMPYDATFEVDSNGTVTVTPSEEQAREVYVRVSATTDRAKGTGSDVTSFHWSLAQSGIEAGKGLTAVRMGIATGLAASDKGDPSAPMKITFPNAQMSEYLNTVATALAVLVLSRADLAAQGIVQSTGNPAFQLDTAAQETGLEDLARYLVPMVTGPNTAHFFKRVGLNPVMFRSKLLARCRAVANDILLKGGLPSDSVQTLVLEQAMVTVGGSSKKLSEVTWNDLASDYDVNLTILDSLNGQSGDGSDPFSGVAPNPLSLYEDPSKYDFRIGGLTIPLERSPGFFYQGDFSSVGGMGTGSADYSPVLYTIAGPSISMVFCRNVFLDNPTVLSATGVVLNVAAASLAYPRKPGEGAWIAMRLFPQGLPPIEAALNEIIGFLEAIKSGIKAITDVIVAYIEFIEARILELEALLRRIQGLLDLILSIEVPLASALVVTGNGTDGILQALVSAEDKPQDTATSYSQIITSTASDGTLTSTTVQGGAYGAGVVLLAGGLPTSVVELLQLMFVEA